MRFPDIRINQSRVKGYQPKPKAEADITYRDLDYLGSHENRAESNNCFDYTRFTPTHYVREANQPPMFSAFVIISANS